MTILQTTSTRCILPTCPTSLGDVNYHGKKITNPEVRARLQNLSHLAGQTIHVTSGDRTEKDQERLLKEGKHPAKNSQHLHGNAADIYVLGMSQRELARLAQQAGFHGIGIYRSHVHVDTRKIPVTWYKNASQKRTL